MQDYTPKNGKVKQLPPLTLKIIRAFKAVKGITDEEIAEFLGISRQELYTLIKLPDENH